jgi:hypothetical protein
VLLGLLVAVQWDKNPFIFGFSLFSVPDDEKALG